MFCVLCSLETFTTQQSTFFLQKTPLEVNYFCSLAYMQNTCLTIYSPLTFILSSNWPQGQELHPYFGSWNSCEIARNRANGQSLVPHILHLLTRHNFYQHWCCTVHWNTSKPCNLRITEIFNLCDLNKSLWKYIF